MPEKKMFPEEGGVTYMFIYFNLNIIVQWYKY